MGTEYVKTGLLRVHILWSQDNILSWQKRETEDLKLNQKV
jgi:hypothetical protein